MIFRGKWYIYSSRQKNTYGPYVQRAIEMCLGQKAGSWCQWMVSRTPRRHTALIESVSEMFVMGSPSTSSRSARAPGTIRPRSVSPKRRAGVAVAARWLSIQLRRAVAVRDARWRRGRGRRGGIWEPTHRFRSECPHRLCAGRLRWRERRRSCLAGRC